MTRVFVSSVFSGFATIRKQVLEDLRTAGFDVGAMEHFGAQIEQPIEVCLREIRKADVVVLIVGPRYGSLLPQGISYTHAEFREARATGIPVLAFVVPSAPDLTTEEQSQLDDFLEEVGGTTTYDALSQGESLDRLPSRVLASLEAARRRGDLGGRYSPFQPFERFFAPQLSANNAIFNHRSTLIGRDAELAHLVSFLQGNERALLLKAPGGSGKSRLLLEAARVAPGEGGLPRIRFVDTGAQWTAADINELPDAPLVLIFDDAHRRIDLDRVIAACLQHDMNARFVVSCRPSAVNLVRPNIAVLLDGTIPELELAPLTREQSETLARHHLPNGLHHLAPRLVDIADRNPLVITVGARCIADNRVPPDVLERTPEVFRTVVLDRLLDDPGLRTEAAVPTRKILEVLSAVGPISTENDNFLATLAKVAQVAEHDVRRILATLEKTAFLIRRGRLVRVNPDVLADHLLYRAAVDENGKPTGFVEAMIAEFSPVLLGNILANAAELDWRAAAVAKHESVLTRTWHELLAALPAANRSQRAQLLSQTKRAAAFAPQEVLRIAEWLADHPDAPPDESLAAWGISDSPDRVNDALTEIFGFLATHPDFTERCLRRLWHFAAIDERATSSNPGHARRRLGNLLQYGGASDWSARDGAHVKAIAFVIARLRDPQRKEDATWAIDLLGSVLARLGESNVATRRQFTLRQFSLDRHLDQLAERRKEVWSFLRDIAIGPRPAEAAAALQEISKALYMPRGPFGKELDAEEIAAWKPEAELAIAILAETATASPKEVIRYLARRALRDASPDRWPAIGPALKAALDKTPQLPSEPLYDLLAGIPREERLDSYQEEERRVDERCRAAATASWDTNKSPEAVIKQVLDGESALQPVAVRTGYHTGRLVNALLETRPDQGVAIVLALVGAGEPGWKLLRPAILALHDREPATAAKIVDQLTRSTDQQLRAYAADPMQWMTEGDTAATVLGVARRLASDSSSLVRQVAARTLGRYRDGDLAEYALTALVDIQWDNDLALANAVLDVLHPQYGLDPGRLTDAQLDMLLSRIERLPSLEGRIHDVLEFIAFASTRRPEQTVQMLLNRVRAVDEHSGANGDDRWIPLPYNGHGLTLPGIQKAPTHRDLLRRIRDAYLNASVMVHFWLPTLFGAAALSLPDALAVLSEWTRSGDPEKLAAAAHLMESWDHSIVFSAHEFVADLLDAADKVGRDCLQRVSGALYSVSISGVHTSAPGQPAPRYLNDKSSAQALATQYASRPVVKDFYDSLVAQAETSIQRDLQEWDEEGDD